LLLKNVADNKITLVGCNVLKPKFGSFGAALYNGVEKKEMYLTSLFQLKINAYTSSVSEVDTLGQEHAIATNPDQVGHEL